MRFVWFGRTLPSEVDPKTAISINTRTHAGAGSPISLVLSSGGRDRAAAGVSAMASRWGTRPYDAANGSILRQSLGLGGRKLFGGKESHHCRCCLQLSHCLAPRYSQPQPSPAKWTRKWTIIGLRIPQRFFPFRIMLSRYAYDGARRSYCAIGRKSDRGKRRGTEGRRQRVGDI